MHEPSPNELFQLFDPPGRSVLQLFEITLDLIVMATTFRWAIVVLASWALLENVLIFIFKATSDDP